VRKYFCTNCEHLFSQWIGGNLKLAQTLFDYGVENAWSHEQTHLLHEAVVFHGGGRGAFLDFGCGANISPYQCLRTAFCLPQNYDFFGCDLFTREEPNYFITYDEARRGQFSGIASSNVLEHLDNTFDAWQWLNRMLAPVRSERTVMVHSFPSLLHYDMSHWGVQIRSHVCLFSGKSLSMICDECGFQLVKWKWRGDFRFPIFYFVKTKDVG